MGVAEYVLDSGCKACERLVCMPPCVLMLCEAFMKRVKVAHQQRPSTRSMEVDLTSYHGRCIRAVGRCPWQHEQR
jgi:hypothetical protein